jgi:hypothetical protein
VAEAAAVEIEAVEELMMMTDAVMDVAMDVVKMAAAPEDANVTAAATEMTTALFCRTFVKKGWSQSVIIFWRPLKLRIFLSLPVPRSRCWKIRLWYLQGF